MLSGRTDLPPHSRGAVELQQELGKQMLLSLNALNLQTAHHTTAHHSTASGRCCSRQTVGRLWFRLEVSKRTFRCQLAVADRRRRLAPQTQVYSTVRQCDSAAPWPSVAVRSGTALWATVCVTAALFAAAAAAAGYLRVDDSGAEVFHTLEALVGDNQRVVVVVPFSGLRCYVYSGTAAYCTPADCALSAPL